MEAGLSATEEPSLVPRSGRLLTLRRPLDLSRAPPNLLRRDSHQKNIICGPRVLNECASAWPTMPETDSTTDQATDASTGSRVAFSSVSLRSLAVSFSGDFWALVSGEHTERPSK